MGLSTHFNATFKNITEQQLVAAYLGATGNYSFIYEQKEYGPMLMQDIRCMGHYSLTLKDNDIQVFDFIDAPLKGQFEHIFDPLIETLKITGGTYTIRSDYDDFQEITESFNINQNLFNKAIFLYNKGIPNKNLCDWILNQKGYPSKLYYNATKLFLSIPFETRVSKVNVKHNMMIFLTWCNVILGYNDWSDLKNFNETNAKKYREFLLSYNCISAEQGLGFIFKNL